MLAEVYGRFDEGFDSHDLQAASALLRALVLSIFLAFLTLF